MVCSKLLNLQEICEIFHRWSRALAFYIQTGKVKQFPVVLFGRAYWGGLADWLKQRVAGEGKISPEDLNLFLVTDDPKEALRWIVDARERRTRAFRAMSQVAQATR